MNDDEQRQLDEVRQAITSALERYPERVEMLPLDALVMDSARANAKRPAYLKIAVPDEVVKALRGPAEKRDHLHALVAVPRAVAERAQSRIILPGEA